jgi:YbbR domain-containing protein
MNSIRALAIYAVLAACVLWTMVSCSFQIAADGAKSFSVDAGQAAKVIEALNQK